MAFKESGIAQMKWLMHKLALHHIININMMQLSKYEVFRQIVLAASLNNHKRMFPVNLDNWWGTILC